MEQEAYTPGYTPNSIEFMGRRRVETHAAFFLPHLRAGCRLLDVGCGPGTITLGLARRIHPGTVTAVDLETSQTEAARRQAAGEGLAVDFRQASIYELPFDAAAFDAAFSHALFEHLARPVDAARELWRVLRPGGAIGLRAPDWGGFLLYPELPEALAAYQRIQTANGGNVHAGRSLGAVLRSAGFRDVTLTASYEIYEDPAWIAGYLAHGLEMAGEAHDRQLMLRLAAESREWGRHPDAVFAQAWVEAVAWK
jgi:SAM-dependent methyltransferase